MNVYVDTHLEGIATLTDIVAALDVIKAEYRVFRIGNVARPYVQGNSAEISLGMGSQQRIHLLESFVGRIPLGLALCMEIHA